MPSGCSLKFMMEEMPDRAFDVGIAEQHAVTFSAGMATRGLVPFCNIYSTFMQRAYDQVIHDVAIQNLHVVFVWTEAASWAPTVPPTTGCTTWPTCGASPTLWSAHPWTSKSCAT